MNECKYPHLKPDTGYKYGCHCDRCRLAHNRTNRLQRYRKQRREWERQRSTGPIDTRQHTSRPNSLAFGGC